MPSSAHYIRFRVLAGFQQTASSDALQEVAPKPLNKQPIGYQSIAPSADLQSRTSRQIDAGRSVNETPLTQTAVRRSIEMHEDSGGSGQISDLMERLLLHEQLRSIVKEAAAAGGTLQIGPHAKRLSETQDGIGLTQRNIADELIMIAAQAGVPIEINHSP